MHHRQLSIPYNSIHSILLNYYYYCSPMIYVMAEAINSFCWFHSFVLSLRWRVWFCAHCGNAYNFIRRCHLNGSEWINRLLICIEEHRPATTQITQIEHELGPEIIRPWSVIFSLLLLLLLLLSCSHYSRRISIYSTRKAQKSSDND